MNDDYDDVGNDYVECGGCEGEEAAALRSPIMFWVVLYFSVFVNVSAWALNARTFRNIEIYVMFILLLITISSSFCIIPEEPLRGISILYKTTNELSIPI